MISRRILSAAGSETPFATRRPSVPMIRAVRRSLIGPASPGIELMAAMMRALRPRFIATSQTPSTVARQMPRNISKLLRSQSEAPRTRADPVLENGLELRHDVDQKEQQNDDGRCDQEQRVADRRIEALV